MKRSTLVLSIVIFALVLRVAFVFHTPVRIWDEAVYANLGHDLCEDPLDYSLRDAGWSDFIPGDDEKYAWPNIGFRAPLLPYTLSIFYLLNIDSLIIFFNPIIGALSVFLIYLLGKKMFNEDVGIYSAIFLAVIPLHVLNSGFIFTGIYGIFLLLLGTLAFWKSFEEGISKYAFACGALLGLAVLARYTILCVLPIFPIYLVMKKNLSKNVGNVLRVLVSFIAIMTPWFIYGYVFYGNFLGAFIHGSIAAKYWGGAQGILFYFRYWLTMFSAIGILLLFGLFSESKKRFKENGSLFMGLFFFVFLILSFFTAHKEQRFIMPLVIPICILSARYVSRINKKRLVAGIVVVISIMYVLFQGYTLVVDSYSGTNLCYKDAMDFIAQIPEDILVINDESSVIYYYTGKDTAFFPGLDIDSIRNRAKNSETYLLYTSMNMPLYIEKNEIALENWENSFEKVFECDKDLGLSRVYKVN